MRSDVDSAGVELSGTASLWGKARKFLQGIWDLFFRKVVRRYPTKGWESSIDNPTEGDISALWSYATQQGGKDVLPLEDFLKTREVNNKRKFQKAV